MKIYLFLLLSISSFRNQKVYGNEFGNDPMLFLSTSIIGIDALHDLLRTEQPIRFNERPFPMHPFGVNGIQPGAFAWQTARQDAHTLPGLLDEASVQPPPRPHLVAAGPRRVIPDQQHRSEPLRGQALTAPSQKRRGLPA